MAKVDRNTIDNALNEANQLEYELSCDKEFRELDKFEDWRAELEPEHEPLDDWYYHDDYFDSHHWDCSVDDYDHGDY